MLPPEASLEDVGAALRSATWIDLLEPTAEQAAAVESALGIELPTRKEAQEIEVSSRLYSENGTIFMTATVVVRSETERPETTAVTFAYQPRCLVTLRFATPRPFTTFLAKVQRAPESFSSAQRVIAGLFDEVIDRLADILETVGVDLYTVSGTVFGESPEQDAKRSRIDYTAVLNRIGHAGERAAYVRESLVSLGRALTYYRENLPSVGGESLDEHGRTLATDVAALSEHATFLSGKVNFFLDATLGRINIEQNNIIKLFSVLAVIFLPPTLIASIYGMNFAHMPELGWVFGYPVALVLMVAAALTPYIVFKRRGWL
jgi:magnesium transporter